MVEKILHQFIYLLIINLLWRMQIIFVKRNFTILWSIFYNKFLTYLAILFQHIFYNTPWRIFIYEQRKIEYTTMYFILLIRNTLQYSWRTFSNILKKILEYFVICLQNVYNSFVTYQKMLVQHIFQCSSNFFIIFL